MIRTTCTASVVFLSAATLVSGVGAQTWEQSDEGWCDDWGGRDVDRHCMVLSAEIADPGSVRVDGGQNGGVSVEGWDRNVMEVRAKVWANARDEETARELADAVTVEFSNGELRARGPRSARREGWGVSWELRVPHATDLDIETQNGGVSVGDVSGRIRFDAVNGGVHLFGASGDVEGRTTNGGLHVELAGDRWDGAGLDVATTNGGVTVEVPSGYSARLETATVNGGMDIDFPVTVQGRIGRSLDVTLGEGGPLVRAVTTNGGVKIVRGSRGVIR